MMGQLFFVTRLLPAVGMALALGLANALCARAALHLLQLESYQLPGYFRALRRVGARVWLPGAALACLQAALAWLWARQTAWMWGMCAATVLCGLLLYMAQRRAPAKKPLVFTHRAKRLCAVLWAVQALLALLPSMAFGLFAPYVPWAAALCALLAPLVLALAAWLAQPMEARINRRFFRDAQRRLAARPGLIRIGITGSYGKTSTKFLLQTLLSEKYETLATPASFNTPMGVTRVIREQLKPTHQVFIAEMGARHVGDIREMCELVRPVVGILTSVGPQHLETFGTLARVAATKYELIEALPPDGTAFFARDGGICEQLYAKCPVPKRLAGASLAVEDLRVGPQGSAFTLVDGAGRRVACETRLLGQHNIDNLLLCCEVALHLGLGPDELARGIAKLQPVEHRLQLLATGNGVTVIDDAFNSNPAGAKAALAVLAAFPPRRIVVTPGMVELGEQQDELNRAFGRQMAAAADIAILVGRRQTEPIAQGLLDAGFAPENLHCVATLDESTALLGSLVHAGDTVLYENDLPDNYAQ
ncbi:MAG: UDP-N-acetylmuramoyl-tripeptide--D-alanyl-D-alanine ligase [Oscillospiraceae bacterium]|jgi:UDP-N-acetylmuramoyl-tripeptide--D-alanyl-D-alanine ligase|nr:UDP-N-acetylmuramoyl-tripeptide--D-alanyl-D-alanine ligase [Oscillospiraceae bacterium]